MTLEEVKNYLRIDDDYNDTFLIELIEISQVYIDSMVGIKYKTNERAVKLSKILQYKLIADMYENRNTTIKNELKQDRIVISILDSLAMVGVING